MIKSISQAIEALFAPVFELLSDLPPSAVNRLFAPF